VIVGARTLAKGEEAAGRLRSEGVDAAALQLDVGKDAAEQVEREHMASLGADGPTGRFVDEGGTVAW
jgi:hypothetical protein